MLIRESRNWRLLYERRQLGLERAFGLRKALHGDKTKLRGDDYDNTGRHHTAKGSYRLS